jgi:hypothetical protein
MSTDRVQKIVRELLAIYLKYGASDFERAIQTLESGEVTSLIARVASDVGKVGNRAHLQRTKSSMSRPQMKPHTRGFSSFVEQLQKREGQSAREIADFIEAIVLRKSLRTAVQLREFANFLGLSYKKQERTVIAKQIAERLINLRPTELQSAMSVAHQLENKRSSLQEWSNVIVKGN